MNAITRIAKTDPSFLLTMEKQFCRLCWGKGLRVKVFDLAVERPNRGFTLRRRNAAVRHLRREHPEVGA
jgi:hypothetical protein